ncbi:MAG: hypothetical protein ACFFC7_30125 [Candidatus Hermodarchaeota archaeon]
MQEEDRLALGNKITELEYSIDMLHGEIHAMERDIQAKRCKIDQLRKELWKLYEERDKMT